MEPTYADTTLRRCARSIVECTWIVELRATERRGSATTNTQLTLLR
jgi:hypothetical protein